MSSQKGRSNVVDDCCNTHNSMVTRVGERLYDGVFYPHTAGRRHHYCPGQSHSGAETVIAF